MALRFERTIAGEVAYLDGRRDGPVLMWGPGAGVRFAFNRPGAPSTRVDNPERFGGTPRTAAQFREFARKFAAAGPGQGRTRRAAGGQARTRSTTPPLEPGTAVELRESAGPGSAGLFGVVKRQGQFRVGYVITVFRDGRPSSTRLLPRSAFRVLKSR